METATLKSIAEATGYSVTTVSRALGGYNDVNEQTRTVILEEAARQGYHPNLNARMLRAQRSQTVGLIIPTRGPRFFDPFFSEFVAGVGNQAASEGFDLLLSTHAPAEPGELDVYRRMIAGRRVDGLIIVRTRHNDPRIAYLQETQLPFVVYGRTENEVAYTYIDIDGIKSQSTLTQHFIDMGHQLIAYVAPPADLMFSQYRLQGYQQTLIDNGLPFHQEYVAKGYELTEQGGQSAADFLFSLPTPPTAIMTGNDLMALGVMTSVREHGLRVGEDIAIGGFDDIPTAEYVGLTTLRQPVYDIGQRLTRTLLNMIDDDEAAGENALLATELIIRRSSGPNRTREQ